MIRDIAAEDRLPDYTLALLEGDVVRVRVRAMAGALAAGEGPRLGPQIHDQVRTAAPGLDPYFLEAEWRRFWQASGRPRLMNPEAAFLAFVRARASRPDVPRAEHRRHRRDDA
jgi:hypothetical protein